MIAKETVRRILRGKISTLNWKANTKKRFKEKMQASASNTDENGNVKDEKEEKISVEDLNFNGKTE